MRVPEGWKEGKVSDLVKSLDAGVSVNSEDKRPEYGQFSVLKTSCVSSGSFNRNERKVVLDINEISRLKEPVKGDTIIISRMNTPALVGANAYTPESLENTYLPDRLWQVKPRKNSVNMLWLGLWFSSKHTRYLLSNLATGTSGTMKNITKSDVLSIRIDIPPPPEQQKIAQIISTWDKAIEKLESLIAAKQKRKKALMQQLLTGKMRLPGFDGEWKEIKLKNLCSIVTGKKDVNEGNENGDFPFFTCAKDPTKSDSYSFDTEAILISGNGVGVGYSHYINGKFEAYQRTYVLSDFSKNISVRYLLNWIKEFLRIEILREKQDSAMPYIKLGLLQFFKVLCPTIDEQQKIASVLSAADNEIATHQNQLAALKQQKKGLMQQLLTGKKRVDVSKVV